MKNTINWANGFALLFLISVFCVLLIFAGDLFVLPFIQGKFTARVPMPSIVGLDSTAAVQLLISSGFKVGEVERMNNDSVKVGRVICQTPLPGEEVKKKRHIRFVLSLGHEMVRVPSLTDLSPSQAGDSLQRLGLRLGEISEVFQADLTPGAIIASSPSAGHRVPRGSMVNITISQNNLTGETYVPDFVNTSIDEARALLAKCGLRMQQLTSRKVANVLPRTILEQSVKAGTLVEKETFIDFVVAE